MVLKQWHLVTWRSCAKSGLGAERQRLILDQLWYGYRLIAERPNIKDADLEWIGCSWTVDVDENVISITMTNWIHIQRRRMVTKLGDGHGQCCNPGRVDKHQLAWFIAVGTPAHLRSGYFWSTAAYISSSSISGCRLEEGEYLSPNNWLGVFNGRSWWHHEIHDRSRRSCIGMATCD